MTMPLTEAIPSRLQPDECRGQPGFVGCPHCDGPVDVRAEIHAAVGDFLDALLLALDHSKRGRDTLQKVWEEARERRWTHLERVFPFDLLEPFWGDLVPDPKAGHPQPATDPSVGGAAGTAPEHRALLPRRQASAEADSAEE
jgi:hypothetical protein